MKKSYDIIVIGGGPGGSAAATFLAQKGYSVCLLERSFHPRPTVGESLIPHFWKYTDLMGVTKKIEEANFIQKAGGMSLWEDHIRGMSFSNFGYTRPGMHVERHQFDKILFDHASSIGVDTFEGIQVLRVEYIDKARSKVYFKKTKEDTSHSTDHLESTFVIDATGQGSLMSKQAGIKEYHEDFRFHSFWAYFQEMNYFSSVDDIQPFKERRNIKPKTLQKKLGGWGWMWHIVLKNSVSIGIVLERKNLQKFKEKGETLKERFIKTCLEDEVISKLLTTEEIINNQVHSIKDYSYYSKKFFHENTFMVGDAAAFVDPINSAGILMALYSAYFSSWIIDRAFQKPGRADDLKEFYHQSLESRFNLFRAAALPKKYLSQEILDSCRTTFKSMSDSELQLIMTQLSLTQRSYNLLEYVDNLGVQFSRNFTERKFSPSNYDFDSIK